MALKLNPYRSLHTLWFLAEKKLDFDENNLIIYQKKCTDDCQKIYF